MRAILSIGEALPPGPERKRLISPLRAVLVLLFAAMLVLLAFLVFVLPAGNDTDRCRDICYEEPNTQFKQAVRIDATHWEVEVWGICDRNREPANYKAVLWRNGTVVDILDPLDGISDVITFTDEDGDGCVSAGDVFMVYCDPGSTYELSLVWKENGMERGSKVWET